MRFRQLDLKAFGPFTDARLDFGDGAVDLHILYGLNEAGKSCALRAVRALLYGVPVQTKDNFVHEHRALRIGGVLERADGGTIAFVRRKGQRDTILAAGEEAAPLGDEALAPFLRGVDERLFSTVFGIDHEALVQGGRAILAGGGEVGESLFAAGLGSLNLSKVIGDLEEKAKSLFAPRGQNPVVNKALSDFGDAKRRMAELSLSGREWDEHDRALKAARTESEQVAGEIGQLNAERTRLERLQRILPILAKRADRQARLTAMGSVVVLPADFAERRRDAQRRLKTAQEEKQSAADDVARLEKQTTELSVPQALLDEESGVTDLHERLGSHRKAGHDLPGLRAKEQQLRAEAEDFLRDLRPGLPVEQIDALRLTAAQRTRIRALGEEYQRLVEQRKQAEANARRAERRLAEAQRQLGVELGRLDLWTGSVEDLERLPVPATESVDAFEARFSRLESDRTAVGDRIEEMEAEVADLTRRIEELRLAGAVPTEADLAAARERRGALWRLIRRAWIAGEDVTADARAHDPERDLPEAYERSVAGADELADRLRREADRVARHAEFLAQRQARADALARLRDQRNEVTQTLQETERAWAACWRPAGITPRSPREMRAWLTRHATLRQAIDTVRREEGECKGAADTRDLAQQDLDRWRAQWSEAVLCLSLEGAALPAEANAAVEQLETLSGKWEELKGLAERVRGIENDAARFSGDVAALVRRVVPDSDALPAEQAAERLFARLTRAQRDQATREGLDQQIAEKELAAAKAEQTILTVERQLADLCREAQCQAPEALPELEARSEEYRSLRDEMASLEERLLTEGAGATLDALAAEAADVRGDELPAQIATLEGQLQELADRRSALDQQIGQEREVLSRMDGRDAAAEAAERAQGLLAQARAGAERYVRLRLAVRVLRDAIERYRAEHQAPLLSRASDLFADLTVGSFTRLEAEYGEDDQPVLVGIRASGKHAGVEAMSDGTRDQLYLSLRFASLERLIGANEPMPFIVDDILIRFDDERAAATLKVLADLSRRTQVLFFTHHARLVDLAQGLSDGRALIHTLMRQGNRGA